jgi:putative effector of murein hydrolase LrgA (UPF0299 family)
VRPGCYQECVRVAGDNGNSQNEEGQQPLTKHQCQGNGGQIWSTMKLLIPNVLIMAVNCNAVRARSCHQHPFYGGKSDFLITTLVFLFCPVGSGLIHQASRRASMISFINSENVNFYHTYLFNPLATKAITGVVTTIPRPRTLSLELC